MYEYRCKIVRVVDGDTVDVDIDLGFGMWLKKQRIRLYGIDTPESRTRDKVEKQFGLMSKEFLKNRLKEGAVLKTRLDKRGKFGRILGEFTVVENEEDLVNVNQEMVTKHLAVEYHGQSKSDIEEEHLVNRTLLNKN